MLWDLFITFLKIGIVSFGGGYSVIPLIQYEVADHGWLAYTEYQEAIAIAGMSPGPIATNSATLIGYQTAGLGGAIVSTLGIFLPSLLAVIILTAIFYRLKYKMWFRSTFYGLRPIITGLILYAALHFGFLNDGDTTITWATCATLAICAGCLYGMYKYKLHPVMIILLSGAVGIILF